MYVFAFAMFSAFSAWPVNWIIAAFVSAIRGAPPGSVTRRSSAPWARFYIFSRAVDPDPATIGRRARRRIHLPDRVRDPPGRARAGARGARLRIALRHGAHPYPRGQEVSVAARRRARAAPRLLAYVRPVRGARGRRDRDGTAGGRHGYLPRGRARSDCPRQVGGQPRRPVRGALRVRYRRGLELGGDGEPRDGLRDTLGRRPRARRGDEGDLDEGGGLLRRRARPLRANLAGSEAAAEAASADPARGRARERAGAGRRLLRRLDAGRVARP